MNTKHTPDTMLQEVVDRARRIETRLTRYLERQGMDTKVRTPFWEDGTVRLPSMATSLEEVLAAIPKSWDTEDAVELIFQGAVVGELYVGPPKTT